MSQDPQLDPSGSAETPAGPTETQGELHPVGEIAPPSDAVAQLQAELAVAKQESEQWRDRFLRKAAELENFRKRAERERTDAVHLAKSAVLEELLQVVDGLERALGSFGGASAEDDGLRQYRDGIGLLHKQMVDSLQRLGVTALQTIGQPFDPHLHEALSRLETAEHEENTVVQELRRGYLFLNRLLRPAQVVVSARPRNESRPED